MWRRNRVLDVQPYKDGGHLVLVLQWTILKRLSFVDVCLQDPLGVGDEAAVGAEQRFCRAMMIGDDMFPQRTLLATHHLQTLTTKKCNVWTWTRDLISECLFGQELLWSRQRVVDFFSTWTQQVRNMSAWTEAKCWVSSIFPTSTWQAGQETDASRSLMLSRCRFRQLSRSWKKKYELTKWQILKIAWRVAHLVFDKISQR